MCLESPLTISVVIPLYNKADHIRKTIESVLAQTRSPKEILVIDDGSTDGGDRVVEKLAPSEKWAPSVSLIRRPHAGVSATRNFGIEVAKGELVAFLDADDAWNVRFLESVASMLMRFPHVCAASSAYEYRYKTGRIWRPTFAGVPNGSFEGIIDYFSCMATKGAPPINSSNVIVRRTALTSVGGFPLGARWGEDHDTWARLALFGDIAFTTETLAIINVIATNRVTDNASPRPPLPAIATITAALAGSTDQKRRENLKSYLKRLVFINAKINLRYGHSLLARQQLISYRRLTGFGPHWLALMFCSFLPQPSIRMLVRARKSVATRVGQMLRAQLQW